MIPRRLFALFAPILLLTAPVAEASSTYQGTDDPDLVYEATIGDLKAALATLKRDEKPDITDDQGHTALMRAAEHGHIAIIKLLLENGAVINRGDELGKTALIWAAEGGNGDAIDLLIQSGARIEQATKQGITPLMAAARTGQIDAVIHLLAAGAQPDRSDYSGRDPLAWAQEGHNSKVIDLIRKAQAQKH
ncbi:MAG: ankyrin repeat domain-containing protein [Aliidongia sp.]